MLPDAMYNKFNSLLPIVLLSGLLAACGQTMQNRNEPVAPDGKKDDPAVLYRSADEGRTWAPFAAGLPPDATISGFSAARAGVYATTDLHGVFQFNQNTGQWQPINNGLPANIDINAIAVMDEVLVLGTFGQGIFLSTDAGRNWSPAAANIDGTAIRALAEFNGKLFAGTDSGIYESADKGRSWSHIYGNEQINGFTVMGEKMYAALSDGAGMSKDSGKTWQYIFKPNTLHDISNDGRYIYAMTLGGGLLRTKNDGQNWENVNNGLGPLNLYTFEVKNIGPELFAAQWYGIYRSLDGGGSWRLVTGLPDSTAFTTLEVTPSGLLAGIGLRKQ